MPFEAPSMGADWISAEDAVLAFGLDANWLDIKNSCGALKRKRVVFGTVFYSRSEVEQVRAEDVLSSCQTRFAPR